MTKWWLFLVVFLFSCNSVHVPETFTDRQVETKNFDIAVWQKITDSDGFFKIYIEGDGAAFNTHGYPSSNPTPKGTMFREIAFGDKNPNVVYLGRPCQYIQGKKCTSKYWTTARFAPEVIESLYQVIKQIAQNHPVVLVGFSGGAQVAGLIAVLYSDLNVKKIVTVGGTLDHKAWTDYHHLPALNQSLNLVDYKEAYLKIPQKHYIGEKDKIIPPFLIQQFAREEQIEIVSKASHQDGWKNMYSVIQEEN
ncbi:MAG: hypothetical protein J6W96_05380 [Alphaproteobacteria bacterium]|nr:hypothetical protein [Alphaproteobacteria bacterium]